MVPAAISLLAGLDAGLLLLDVPAPVTVERLPEVHGMLLVLGFVGTLVALERSIALGTLRGFAAPAGFGLGGLALLSPADVRIGKALLVVGGVALLGVYRCLWRRQASDALLVQAGGAVAAAGGVTHDVARRTVRTQGLPRFMAACLLAGYAWLAVAGGLWLVTGPAVDGPRYDAVVHAVFLGFTMSMIMAHAPVILPAVLRRPLPYHPVMWAPAVLLQGSLAVRIGVGDARALTGGWQVGGVLGVGAVLAFAAVAVAVAGRDVVRGRPRPHAQPRSRPPQVAAPDARPEEVAR